MPFTYMRIIYRVLRESVDAFCNLNVKILKYARVNQSQTKQGNNVYY